MIFTIILLTIRMLKFAALIINRGVESGQIAMVFVSIIPTFLEIALPLGALLGVMLAFGRLSQDSEIIVLRSTGLSLKQIAPPVVGVGILVLLLGCLVSLQLRPWGYRTLSETLFEIARTRTIAGLDAGVFNDLGNVTLYAERIDHQTGALTNLIIDDRRDPKTRQVVFAPQGWIESDAAARVIILRLGEGFAHELVEGRYVMTKFVSNRILMDSSEMMNEDADKRGRKPAEYSRAELLVEVETLQEMLKQEAAAQEAAAIAAEGSAPEEQKPALLADGESPRKRMNKLNIELARRYVMPGAGFILALLGMALGIQSPRTQKTWGAGLSATLGMLVFVFYYVLLSVAVTIAENGALNPYFGLWIPNVLMLLTTLAVLQQLYLERWQSVADGIDPLWRKIRHIIPGRKRRAA